MILDNYCSMVQPLIYAVGTHEIDDTLVANVVKLAVYAFNTFAKVSSGGLLILNGLIATVEGRIEAHVAEFISYLEAGIKMDQTDEMGCRLACGLISDISNSIGPAIVPFLPQIIAAL